MSGNSKPQGAMSLIEQLQKADLHRHLLGSITLDIYIERDLCTATDVIVVV
jgi:hypothetical protein